MMSKRDGDNLQTPSPGDWEWQSLEHIQPLDRLRVGNKAFQLSQLSRKGYPVVPSLVLPAQAMQEFLEIIQWSAPLLADLPNSSLHLDVDNPRQLQLVARHLRQEIINATVPQEWLTKLLGQVTNSWETTALIFRPSLTFPKTTLSTKNIKVPGLLEPHICTNKPVAIVHGLKCIWAELFRARSLLYWQRSGMELQEMGLAVLMQPLTDAIASGFLTYLATGLEIQASWGLGIAIVRGEVLPDSYLIQPDTGVVQAQHLGYKTIAYGLVDSPIQSNLANDATLLPQSTNGCLQTYLLSEAQQQGYALNEKYLQQLIQFSQQLKLEIGPPFTLEWTLSQPQADIAPQLYLTEVSTHYDSPLPSIPKRNLEFSHSHFIRGLAAASGRAAANAYVVTDANQRPAELPPGVILVAPMIAPDWLPLIRQAAGVVTEQGGLTCHGAILARELGIPAVVSVAKATQAMQTGELVLLDGNRGEIYRLSHSSDEKDLAAVWQEAAKNTGDETRAVQSRPANFMPNSYLDGWGKGELTTPPPPLRLWEFPIATQLFVNLSQPSSIQRVQNLPIDGVGLLRSELMALTILDGQHPNTWIQQGRLAELGERWQGQIAQFARAFAPRPVFYRSLDWRSHEFPSLIDGTQVQEHPASAPEPNPMLGQRGTLSYQLNPTLFDMELMALAQVQQSSYTNVHLILPFVRTVEEFSFCRQRVEQAGLTQLPQFQLWIMAEVPSVLFLLPQYVKAGVQGVSIGTNDLTQLLLAIDRNQGQLAMAFDERHPAVMQAIAQIIHMAKAAGISCSICGQAPALYPELIDSLVRWGITSISVEPEALEPTYRAIARAEQRLLLEAARAGISQQFSRV